MPKFKEYFRQNPGGYTLSDCCENNPANIFRMMIYYFIDILLPKQNTDEISLLFTVIEELYRNSDKDISNYLEAFFLENLSNIAMSGTIPKSSYMPYIGSKSLRFINEWEE